MPPLCLIKSKILRQNLSRNIYKNKKKKRTKKSSWNATCTWLVCKTYTATQPSETKKKNNQSVSQPFQQRISNQYLRVDLKGSVLPCRFIRLVWFFLPSSSHEMYIFVNIFHFYKQKPRQKNENLWNKIIDKHSKSLLNFKVWVGISSYSFKENKKKKDILYWLQVSQ